jgi:hypothetical protein
MMMHPYIWIAGCSKARIFNRHLPGQIFSREITNRKIQIFASDISEKQLKSTRRFILKLMLNDFMRQKIISKMVMITR